LESSDIAGLRLASQRISEPHCDGPAAVVAHMGAMQAQDHGNALWGIGLRSAGASIADVRAAIASGAVVRTWMLRGTLHFVAGADLRWMLALLAARSIAGAASRHRQLELDEPQLATCRKLLAKALRGTRLTRGALFALLDANGIATTGQRGIHILWRLAHDGVLCFAAHEGKQPAFALLDEWLPDAGPTLTRDEALATLAQRYFRSHGPATVADFAWWAGLTVADAKRGAQAAGGLASASIAGKAYWMADTAAERGHAADGVYLLPGFDEYLLGYKDRADVLAAQFAGRIVPGGNGVFKPMIVAHGQIVGTWQRGASDPEPFVALKRADTKALAAALQRYRSFCGEPP
jgi:hypothetical protein